jgi:hypothetical protein
MTYPRDLSGAEILESCHYLNFNTEFTFPVFFGHCAVGVQVLAIVYNYDDTSSGSVVNTKDCPSSPALTITVPFNPKEAAKTAALCPVCVETRVPVRASHVLRVLSADADTNKCDFGAEGVRREVMASCHK